MTDQLQTAEVPVNNEEGLEISIKPDMVNFFHSHNSYRKAKCKKSRVLHPLSCSNPLDHLNLEERDEAKIFIDEFAKYDKEKKGVITVDDIYQIIQTLEKDVRIRNPPLSP